VTKEQAAEEVLKGKYHPGEDLFGPRLAWLEAATFLGLVQRRELPDGKVLYSEQTRSDRVQFYEFRDGKISNNYFVTLTGGSLL
jgi:hypothetical protein